MTSEAVPESWLARAPFALFAQVMGIGGLAIAWRRASAVFGAPSAIGELLFGLAALIFAVVALVHIARTVIHPGRVIEDLRHPVEANFAPALTVALVLMAAGIAPYSHTAARSIWIVAASAHLLLAFVILRRWFTEHREARSASPAWFIPVVGNILMPVIGVPLGFALESWFLFSVGFVFWVILAPVMTHRIFFEEPLPERAMPSLFILLAPPAIGGLAMLALNGGAPSVYSHVLFGFGSFVALLMVSLLGRIVHTHFAVGWWALTFPIAGYASFALAYADARDETAFRWIATIALVLASTIVAVVATRTLAALARGTLIEP